MHPWCLELGQLYFCTPYTDHTQTIHRLYTDYTQTVHRLYTDYTQTRLYTDPQLPSSPAAQLPGPQAPRLAPGWSGAHPLRPDNFNFFFRFFLSFRPPTNLQNQ